MIKWKKKTIILHTQRAMQAARSLALIKNPGEEGSIMGEDDACVGNDLAARGELIFCVSFRVFEIVCSHGRYYHVFLFLISGTERDLGYNNSL